MELVPSCAKTLRAVMSVSVLRDSARWDLNMGLNVLQEVLFYIILCCILNIDNLHSPPEARFHNAFCVLWPSTEIDSFHKGK